jgi:hypothetical protein
MWTIKNLKNPVPFKDKFRRQRNTAGNIGFCASVAGQTNIGKLQIRAVVQAGQTTFNFGS